MIKKWNANHSSSSPGFQKKNSQPDSPMIIKMEFTLKNGAKKIIGNFFSCIFSYQNFFAHKFFLTQNYFWPKFFLDPKFFGTENTIFLYPKSFWTQNFEPKNFFLPWMSLDQHFLDKTFFVKVCFYSISFNSTFFMFIIFGQKVLLDHFFFSSGTFSQTPGLPQLDTLDLSLISISLCA